MEQKFVSFEDAVEKLGISAERLHSLREEGQLRAYRDGKSWKFRTDEIEKMVEGGVPDAPPPSDIGLVSNEDLVAAAPIEPEEDELELSLADDDDITPAEPVAPTSEGSDLDIELSLDDTDAVPGEKELALDGLDDTVTSGSDVELDLELPEAGPSDSILLSEETLGESVSGSPSTIIGRDKLGSGDDDLELALDDPADDDAKTSPSAGASDVLSAGVAGSGVLDELTSEKGGTSAFRDLDELEIDLAEESSPALETPEAKADDVVPADAGSELELDMGDSGDIELAGDDDLILADAGGSDLTLDSGDSGINLIAPSDSGLALDDIPLEMGGSAILSSLSLEGSDPEISLIGDDAASGDDLGASAGDSVAELQTDDDFQLTPLSEGTSDEGDSSSQVIALDAEIDDFSEDAAILDDDDFTEEDDSVELSEDFGAAPVAGELDAGYAPVAVAAGPETPYSIANILGLGSSMVLLILAGTMMLDMMRNIWSWDQSFSLNSSLMDAILGWF